MFWQVTLFLLPLRFLQKAKYFFSLSFHRITQTWGWLSGMLSFKYIVLFYIYKNKNVPDIVSQLQTPLVFGCYQKYFLNKLNTKTEAWYVKTIHGFFRSLNLKYEVRAITWTVSNTWKHGRVIKETRSLSHNKEWLQASTMSRPVKHFSFTDRKRHGLHTNIQGSKLTLLEGTKTTCAITKKKKIPKQNTTFH